MPWTCAGCRALVPTDDVAVCPGCGQGKAAWSRTRTLVVSARRFDLLTGVEASRAATTSPGRTRRSSRRRWPGPCPAPTPAPLAEAGRLPRSRHVLVVRLVPRGAKDLTVRVAVEFDTREVEEVDVPAAASPTPEVVDVPLLLVAGADPGHGPPAFSPG